MTSHDVPGGPQAGEPPDSSGKRAGGDGARSRPPQRRARRVRRVLAWGGFGLFAVVALALASAFALLSDLARPSIKARIRSLAQQHAGLAIDYEGLEISPLHGLRARGLRLLQPPKFRAAAEEFLHIDDLEVRARPWEFVRGARTLEVVRVSGVDVTLVRDDHGATSVSELFPQQNAPEPEAQPGAGKLSESLAQLPRLDIARIEVAPVRARMIELHDAEPSRTAVLASVGLHGRVHSEPNSLRGTALELTGAPSARLELQAGAQKQFADVGLAIGARADAADALALRIQTDVLGQNVWPELTHAVELLHLSATVAFDAAQHRTTVHCSDIRALSQVVTGKLDFAVFDAESLRVTADGALRLDGDRLPVQVKGLHSEGLALTFQAKQFAWQSERISGQLAWQGGARSLALETSAASTQLSEASLHGQGMFEGPTGHFESEARVTTLASRSPTATTQLSSLGLKLSGKTHDEAGAQQLTAALTLALAGAELSTQNQAEPARTRSMELHDITFDANTSGSVAAFNAKRAPSVQGELAIAQIATTGRSPGATQRVVLDGFRTRLSGQDLAPDVQSPAGASGAAELALSAPQLRVFNGPETRPETRKRAKSAAKPGRKSSSSAKAVPPRAAIAVDGIALRAQWPLSMSRAAAQLEVASGSTPDMTFKVLKLSTELHDPLAWSPERTGPAELQLTGRAREWTQRAQSGKAASGTSPHAASSGALDNLRLLARKSDQHQYRLEVDTLSSGLRMAGRPVPGRISAELRGGLESEAGRCTATLELRGPAGAAVDFSLEGTLEKNAERLRYRAALSAEKLDAFVELIQGAVPSAAALKIPGTQVRAAAQGELSGVLQRTREGGVALAPHPVTSVRGQQTLELDVSGLDYHTPERSLVVPKLSLRLSSVHGDAGAGSGEARCRADGVHYEGDGTALQIEGFDQTVSAEFSKAPDQGTVELRTKLALGSLAQSQLPAYRVAGLQFAAHLQIERLRSIFLRELSLNNPIAGTLLTARGALELRPRAALGEDVRGDPDTIAGREALALEGRLQQDLEPFEKLGFAARARGRIDVPFRLESGGLLGYRLLASLEAKHVSMLSKDEGVGVEDLNGVVPVIEEFALLPSGPVVSAGPRASPLSETRFFDVHPFLSGNDYLTARSITLRGLQPLGPFAANVRIERSDFLIDQLQVGWNAGQIVGQVRVAYREGDPLVRMRLNATGLRAGTTQDVFDANAALSFVPKAMTLDGKVQLVRVSRAHLLGILDVIDPFHESSGANRVRNGLTLGYPKFVRFQLHDGAVDTKVELGGLASVVRIDEIRAVPMGPILQRYVVPTLASYVKPNAAPIKAEESK